MMPINLTLSAFGPYPNQININFESFREDGLFLITGPTGSGKTMIFDALIFALYGKTSGQMRQSDSLRCDHALNEIPTFVELTFSLHQQIYTIKRSPKYYLEGKKTPKQPTALLTLPDGKMVEGVKEVTSKVISLLGIDEHQFKQIVMIAQGEFTQLIMASSDEREKVLRELFHSEVYQRIEEKLKERLKTYQDQYSLLLNKRKDYQEELNIEEDGDVYLERKRKIIQELETRIQKQEKQKEELNQQIQLYHLQNQRLQNLKENKKRYQDLILQEKDYQKLFKKIQLLKKAKETNYDYLSLKQQEAKINQMKNKREETLQKYQTLEKESQVLEQKYQTLSLKQQENQQLFKQIQEQKQLIEAVLQYQHYYQNLQELKQTYHQLKKENTLFNQKKEKLQTSIERDLETIQSEKQIETTCKLLQQDYQKINNQKIKIHQLSQYYDELLQAIEKRSDLQEEYVHLEKEVDDQRKHYQQLEKLYFRKQAGIFASQLKDNEPCPICGSLHHPHPALLEKEDISKEKLDQQKKVVTRFENKLQEHVQQLLLQKQKIEMKQQQIKQLSTELEIEDVDKESFIKALDVISKDEKEMKKKYLQYQDELKYIQKIKKSVELSQKDMVVYLQKEEKQKHQLEQLQIQIHQLSGKLDDTKKVYEMNQLQDQLLEFERSYQEKIKEVEDLQNKYTKYKDLSIQLQTQIKSDQQHVSLEQKQLDLFNKNYQEHLKSFKDEEEFLHLKEEIDQLSQKEKSYQDYQMTLNSLKQQITSLEDEVKDTKEIDFSSLEKQLIELQEKLKQNQEIYEQEKINFTLKEKLIHQIETINKKLEKDEEIYQRYLDLYNLSSGKNAARVSLERYVLATYFEHMLLYANRIFKQLTQGRYQLIRKDEAEKGRKQQGLELDVFDQESGQLRGIKTLSGGESFKAALSLALGLSRMIQEYAGGIELNTLFIDEGFGSLDSQSLDQAMNCLMELHQDNKLIGIISHVSELKDRIDRQIIVDRKQKQSVIHVR